MEFVGRFGNDVLFSANGFGVVVNEKSNVIAETGELESIVASAAWDKGGTTPSAISLEIANAAMTDLDIHVFADNDRMYTIPKSVQAEAKRALEWHKEHGRGGTPVGMNTARTLAKGGQIGIRKIRHIAKYFPRHEVDKKGKGYKPSEDGYPSNGRIAWALWGGDAAARWASAIVERENKKSASVYEDYEPVSQVNLSAFATKEGLEQSEQEFAIRLFADGSGFDRLYKRGVDGVVSVWDSGEWSDLGESYTKFSEIDAEIDAQPVSKKSFHTPIDTEAALVASAFLDNRPFDSVFVSEINYEESALAADSMDSIDWYEIDAVLAGGADGFTPEERAAAVESQPRDAMGQFAKKGGRVKVNSAGGQSGVIQDIQGTDAVVKLDSGQIVQAAVKDTQAEDTAPAISNNQFGGAPLDVSGILGEPRDSSDPTLAVLDRRLPPLTKDDINALLSDWPAWVADQRAKFKDTPIPTAEVTEGHKAPNAYNDPYLRKWLDEKASGKGKKSYYPNRFWYQPNRPDAIEKKKKRSDVYAIIAAASEITGPESSDIPPVYMAVVAPDDPQAVMDLICLVPASSTSTVPTVFTYKNNKWEQDDRMLTDLKSPTPPPVIVLDDEALDSVLSQINTEDDIEKPQVAAALPEFSNAESSLSIVDKYLASFWSLEFGMLPVTAAGGLDRNRGNAEQLRRYWTHGKGAAKIRWGAPGDWERCYRHLSKYMGPRAKGYCQLRHKEATGMYTSTHAKKDRGNLAVEEVTPIWQCTIISEQELNNILNTESFEHDELYDEGFEPEAEIVVLMQDESIDEFSLVAAGGLDRNRGNAEKLRRYWTIGKGGAKIRWGTGGDWTRCVRHLSKYLGPRAKGYCALRHKEMTGLWTGDKAHRQMYGRKGKGVFAMSDEMILSQEEVVSRSLLLARKAEAKSRVLVASGGYSAPAEPVGSKFRIPVVVPEGIETGDGRKFSLNAISMRELPLPLMWQIKTDEGHYGSVVVGRIDSMERIENGIGNAVGVFDNGDYGREAERLVRGGFIRGISADLDKFEADEDPADASDSGSKGQNKILISKARVMGVTLVPKPAFQECTIELVKEPEEMDSEKKDALVACAAIAASIPVVPPKFWFENPKLAGPTPLTVDDDGRVFGHIAAWHVDHIGLAFGTKPPRSKSQYAYFHTGVVRTQEGDDIPVGQLTLAGGHASLNADARAAAKHYDDTGSAFADVHAGEDAYGIWVSGALRPSTTPEQVRAIRASAPSGDWRPIGGNLELVAVCQVNVPGFPIARARVASGQMYALVAAGASYLARLKDEPELLLAAADDAKARFAAIKSELGLTAGAGCGCCPACGATCDGSCCPNCSIAHTSVEPLYVGPLKKLLADTVGFYFRAHGYHWNVVGEDFAEYHELFGEIYGDVYGSIDPLAENLRKLGAFPQTSLKDFAADSSLADSVLEGGSPKALAADLLMANEALIEELKASFTMMDAANEQGVANFIADRIDAHQKWSWQLASSLSPEDIILVENENPAESFEAVFASLEKEGILVAAGEDFAYIPEKVREKAAEKGQALPDGSFPIRNIKDLKNAVHAYGRAKASKKAAVRKHIIKRAKALGRADLVPDTFNSETIEAQELSAMKAELSTRIHGEQFWADKASELSARFKSLTAAAVEEVVDVPLVDEAEKSGGVDPKFTAKTQPRDAQGRFRDVLARLKQDLGVASLHNVAERIKEVENLDNTGNYQEAAAGARDVIDVVNRIDTKALDPKALSSVRMGASALAEAISNLPLPFQDQAQKVRYSDIPPALRDLMDDMITKVEAKIGSDDAKVATEKLMAFRSGSEVFNQSEISSEMNKLLRLLT